jgi:hypoxanthine-DNA glycosylase
MPKRSPYFTAVTSPKTAKSTPEMKECLLKGSFDAAVDPSVPPHTLILGTQPSDVSLGASRYYDTHTNALWHIVGDALGFRRGWLDGNSRGVPDSISRCLLHDRSLENYDEALALLTARGYAVWDVLKSSERAGSLDGDIKNAEPADVPALVAAHPSIQRICFASGGTTAAFFKKHFKAWLKEEGIFCVHSNRPSQQAFAKLVPLQAGAPGRIELVVMESVSPAYVPATSYGDTRLARRLQAYQDAGYPHITARASAYAWKRQQWFDHCFERELSEAERAKRFGDREGDLLEHAQVQEQVVIPTTVD